MLMTGKPVDRHDDAPTSPSDRMLTTGEIADAAGDPFTRRIVDKLIRDELIPYFRMGKSWNQVPAWVADVLRRRAAEQIELRQQLGRIVGVTTEAEAERDRIRRRLKVLEGPITDPEDPNADPE